MQGPAPHAGSDIAPTGVDELTELADIVPAMIWRSGPDKLRTYFNRTWLDFTGRSLQQERAMGWSEGVHPEDYDRCVRAYVTAFDRRDRFSIDYRLRRHDGSYRWILETGQPFDRDGRFAGYVGTCLDIEERKRLEETRRLLVDEINHRAKNLLASVQAIAHSTFGAASQVEEAYAIFCGRLQAMGSAHDIVTSQEWAGADLASIVRRVARPHGDEGEAFRLEGGPVWLSPKRALALALCLHELFSNAARHGALSAAEGSVRIDWTTDARRARLRWTEIGGPPPEEPGRGGVGLRLIETLGRDAGGRVDFTYRPEGLVCQISFPLDPGRSPSS